ncbi:DUF4921 family protein [Mobiluncus curtisii]|uniref:DUF4921 family protein n=1 Tax=Mobiluncus curtisii TaxID=2051 RepID=UPI0020936E03|nr:DUF4921 family protein [Mobiluncus curtisii]
MADGTIKQRNPLTGTQVWTVTSRGNRPHFHREVVTEPAPLLQPSDFTNTCAFCTDRYFDTPPEKSRLVKGLDAKFTKSRACPPPPCKTWSRSFGVFPTF